MVKKPKEKLVGKRIVLKITKADISTASYIFKVINENRKHLAPWLPWERGIKKVEDQLRYLFDKEVEFKLGKKVDYGIYLKNKYIGNIGIFNIHQGNKSAEIGYWLSADFSGKGYMTEAVKILEKEFFVNHKLNRIQIKCDEKNKASMSVAERCGYRLEGTLREDVYCSHLKSFRNTLLFSKLKSEFNKEKNK